MYTYEMLTGKVSKAELLGEKEREFFRNQRILITGAGGSIGSEIVKQIAKISEVVYLATDHDESRLHSLSMAIDPRNIFPNRYFALMDIRDPLGMNEIFHKFQPTLVIHAAALKHLSVLEFQPRDALLTNVYGTNDLLKLCKTFNVGTFVNISTDKAASPTSVLGRSKRMGEIITSRADSEVEKGKYFSCRFGNVFASRGSVIETFSRQIETGTPISLTDVDVTRFFMETSEAAFLCLKSIFLENHDIYIFDMGVQVKLLDIIQRMMIQAKKQVPIDVTGLRDGEKIHEILSSQDEPLTRTSHELISGTELKTSSFIVELQEAINIKSADRLLNWLKNGWNEN